MPTLEEEEVEAEVEAALEREEVRTIQIVAFQELVANTLGQVEVVSKETMAPLLQYLVSRLFSD